MTNNIDTSDRQIVQTRLLNAPRELVWKVWTDPEHLKHWYGPNGFSITNHEVNIKVGGVWSFIMHGPDGTDYPNKIIFTEVVKPERLVYKHGGDNDSDSVNFHVTVTFEQQGDKTKLTMLSVFESAAALEKVVREYGAIEGGKQTLNRLEEHLSNVIKDREIVTTRVVKASQELVFKAWTDPNHLSQWWGPKGFKNTFYEFDLKPGGVWDFVMHGPDGKDYKNKSIFVEIEKPERIIFDHVSSHKFQVIATFENQGGNTKITFRMIFESVEECSKVKVFVVDANEENFDRLEAELLKMV